MFCPPKFLWKLANTILFGTGLGMMPQPDYNQLGLWIACLVSVVGSVTALVFAYRTFTKEFVTKLELETELVKLKLAFKDELKTTRHDMNESINSAKLQLEVKIEAISAALTENARILGRIEGLLEAQTLGKKRV